MANDNSNKILLGLAALAGGTLLASLLADAFGKSRRRERSTVFFDDEADLSSDTEEECRSPRRCRSRGRGRHQARQASHAQAEDRSPTR
jgi:hypothetical protein